MREYIVEAYDGRWRVACEDDTLSLHGSEWSALRAADLMARAAHAAGADACVLSRGGQRFYLERSYGRHPLLCAHQPRLASAVAA